MHVGKVAIVNKKDDGDVEGTGSMCRELCRKLQCEKVANTETYALLQLHLLRQNRVPLSLLRTQSPMCLLLVRLRSYCDVEEGRAFIYITESYKVDELPRTTHLYTLHILFYASFALGDWSCFLNGHSVSNEVS
jgi:hypothetical protein